MPIIARGRKQVNEKCQFFLKFVSHFLEVKVIFGVIVANITNDFA